MVKIILFDNLEGGQDMFIFENLINAQKFVYMK